MHPIIDIKAFDNDECASDYSPLINRVWPGSYSGCFDQATNKFTRDKTCKAPFVAVHGTGVETIKKFHTKAICVKRSNQKLIDLKRPTPQTLTCQPGYRICGPDS